MWDLAPYFFEGPITFTIFYDPALTWLPAPYYFYYLPAWYYQQVDFWDFGPNPDAYDGKVYILVNEQTQSQGESFCQYMNYHPNSKVFGTQSAGADGEVSYLELPGGITTKFTSMGWYYADGYQLQRNGVRIDTVVLPTVEGIRQERDEILEAALDCLTCIDYLSTDDIKISVYPNPITSRITFFYELTESSQVTLQIYNSNGQLLDIPVSTYQESGAHQETWDSEGFSAGIYFYCLMLGKQSSKGKMVLK